MVAICSGLSEEMTYYWFLQQEIKMEYVTSRLISHYTLPSSRHLLTYSEIVFCEHKILAWKNFNELGKAAEEQANNLQSQLNCQLGQ